MEGVIGAIGGQNSGERKPCRAALSGALVRGSCRAWGYLKERPRPRDRERQSYRAAHVANQLCDMPPGSKNPHLHGLSTGGLPTAGGSGVGGQARYATSKGQALLCLADVRAFFEKSGDDA